MRVINEVSYTVVIKFVVVTSLLLVYKLLLFSPLRALFLLAMGSKVGSGSNIMDVKFFNYQRLGFKGLTIGNDCFIGDDTLIDLYDRIDILDQVTIAQRVTILTHLNVGYKDHPLQKYFPRSSKPVVFKKGCAIGAASIILPGVIIGEQSFVAAGSVVTKNVPARTLVAGVPARVVRKIK